MDRKEGLNGGVDIINGRILAKREIWSTVDMSELFVRDGRGEEKTEKTGLKLP